MTTDKPNDRFKDLEARIKQATTSRNSSKQGLSDEERMGLSMALRMGVEMVAALIVGLGFGYLLDTWLETKPLFLVLFFFAGAGAGILNVYRTASGIGYSPGYRKSQDGEPDDQNGDGAR